MPTDTQVPTLVINRLTKAQYEAIQTKSQTEIYLIPDEIDSVPTYQSTNTVSSGGVYGALQTKAELASPTFTGTPAAPTAASGTNTTQIATTAFVQTAVANAPGEANVIESISVNSVAQTVTNKNVDITVPNAPGTLDTTATTAQSTSANEALSGSVTLHKVAKTGTYSDLIGTPTIPTESTVSGWGFTKNTGTLTGVTFNGTSATVSNGVAAITATIPNITISSSEPTSSQGSNGDIWIVV